MEITLPKDTEKQLLASIQRYAAEHLGAEIGELKAQMLLRFCLQEVGPSIYNQAIADAQGYFTEKTADLENTCFVPEFGYWKDRAKPVARRAGFRP